MLLLLILQLCGLCLTQKFNKDYVLLEQDILLKKTNLEQLIKNDSSYPDIISKQIFKLMNKRSKRNLETIVLRPDKLLFEILKRNPRSTLSQDLKRDSKKIDDISAVLIENDILLPRESINDFVLKQKSQGSATLDKNALWPNGRVNYIISVGHFTASEEKLIRSSIALLESKTCLTFVNSVGTNYLKFIKGSGCYSLIGKNSNVGEQPISIGFGCLYQGTIIHEIIHALGFYHEQSRLDRDNYVDILWSNIMPGLEYNFLKYNSMALTPYDYQSLMHYDNTAFSIGNQRKTIVAKTGVPLIHSAIKNVPSKYDIEKINKLYNCTLPSTTECQNKHPSCEAWFNNGTKCTSIFLEVACQKSCSKDLNECDKNKMLCNDFEDCSIWRNKCHLEYVKYVCQKTCGCL